MGGTSPDDASSGKCFSGILSRILCTRSLPTHPSDQLPDPDAKAFFHRSQESSVNSDHQANNARTPGVVARLMGLESMPDLMVSKGRPFGSFLRSRSVNFIDFLPQIGLTGEAQHRRVRTSMSFREAIGFDKEKHDFLVLCLDSVDETRKEVMPPQKHQAASFPEVKPKKVAEKTNQKTLVMKKKSTERLTEPPSKSSLEVSVPARRRNPNNNVDVNRKESLALKEKRAVKKPVDSRRVSIEPNPARKKKKKSRYVGNNRIQPEYGSILDRPKTSPAKSAENSGKLQKSSKKELLKPSNAVQKHMRTADKAFINDQAPKTVEENVCRARKQETAGSDEKTLLEICRLAEENASEYWWVGGGGVLQLEDSEEICMHFGQQILDVLLNDVVGELVLIHKSRI